MAKELSDGQGIEIISGEFEGALAPGYTGIVVGEGGEPVDRSKMDGDDKVVLDLWADGGQMIFHQSPFSVSVDMER